ncbi:MAG: GtrA family protein [Spirochaetota bacterium]|nr:GtrA family protein [Spirochaetota bacterium]
MRRDEWRAEFGRIIRFGLVGLLNTTLGLGTIYLLQNGLGVDYRIANAIGYALGILTSFILNRIWTFKSTDAPALRQGALFLVNALICWGIQILAVITMVETLGVPKEIAQPLGMVAYTGCNYIGNRLFVFAKTRQQGK